MDFKTIETIVVVVAVIVFVTVRQSRWQPVDLRKLLRMPVIFVVVGVVSAVGALSEPGGLGHWGSLDVVIIAFELVVGLLAGWLMGRHTEIETVTANGGSQVTRSRLRPAGLAVWLGFIGVRIGLGVLGSAAGATFAAQPMTIFLVLAVIKGVQALIIRERIDRHRAELRQRMHADANF